MKTINFFYERDGEKFNVYHRREDGMLYPFHQIIDYTCDDKKCFERALKICAPGILREKGEFDFIAEDLCNNSLDLEGRCSYTPEKKGKPKVKITLKKNLYK